MSSPGKYSFFGSAIGTATCASFMQSLSNGHLGLGAALGILIGGFGGGYLAARLHSSPDLWSSEDSGGVYAYPFFGMPLGIAFFILLK